MKILNVVSVYFSIPFFFGDQIGHFTAKGYDVHLICSPSDKIELFAEKQNAHYKEIPILRKISIWNDLKAVLLCISISVRISLMLSVGILQKEH